MRQQKEQKRGLVVRIMTKWYKFWLSVAMFFRSVWRKIAKAYRMICCKLGPDVIDVNGHLLNVEHLRKHFLHIEEVRKLKTGEYGFRLDFDIHPTCIFFEFHTKIEAVESYMLIVKTLRVPK